MNYLIKHRLIFGLAFLYFLLNLFFFNRYFPITDGWWETYGYLSLKGIVPYSDLNTAFPPMFIIYNSALVKVFGGNFLLFRFLGIIEATVVLLLLYFFLKNYFSRIPATVSAFVASMLLFSDPVYIAKDYHTFMEIFVGLSLLVFSYIRIDSSPNSVNKGLKDQFVKLLLFSVLGMMVAVVGFTKQNVGAFLFLGIFISICMLCGSNYLKKIIYLLAYIGGACVVASFILIWFHYNGIALSDFLGAILHNNAKGSMFTVLFRFVMDKYNLRILLISFVMLYLWNFVYRLYVVRFSKREDSTIIIEGLFVALSLYSMISSAFPMKIKYGALLFIIPLSLAILFRAAYNEFFCADHAKRTHVRFLIIPLLMLAYACTHTSSFSLTGMFFVIGFSIAYALEYFGNYFPKCESYLLLLTMSVIPGVLFSKVMLPYSWWGLEEGPIVQAKYPLPYSQLQGIYTDKCTQDLFSTIKLAIHNYSKTDNDLYLFPHIPIFYYLENKVPPTRNLIQWFDVITSDNMLAELEMIKKNPPELAVVVVPPEYVFKGHYYLLKHNLLQGDLIAYFDAKYKSGDYSLVANKIISKEIATGMYPADPKLMAKITLVPDKRYVGKKLNVFTKDFHSRFPSVVISTTLYDGVEMPLNYSEEHYLSENLAFQMEASKEEISLMLNTVGTVYCNDYYMVRIYRKAHNRINGTN